MSNPALRWRPTHSANNKKEQSVLFSYTYKCDGCGQERNVPGNPAEGHDDSGKVRHCPCGGLFRFSGETYDQEFIDEQRYNERQDREYEERHRRDQ